MLYTVYSAHFIKLLAVTRTKFYHLLSIAFYWKKKELNASSIMHGHVCVLCHLWLESFSWPFLSVRSASIASGSAIAYVLRALVQVALTEWGPAQLVGRAKRTVTAASARLSSCPGFQDDCPREASALLRAPSLQLRCERRNCESASVWAKMSRTSEAFTTEAKNVDWSARLHSCSSQKDSLVLAILKLSGLL